MDPVVLHTADHEVDEAYALEHGASGLLRKPGNTSALRDRIAELLSAKETDRPL